MPGDWLKTLHSTVPTASVDQAFAALNDGAVLLDVRRPDETAAIQLAGALECPRDALELRVEQLVSSELPIYVVCAAGIGPLRGEGADRDGGMRRCSR